MLQATGNDIGDNDDYDNDDDYDDDDHDDVNGKYKTCVSEKRSCSRRDLLLIY